MALGGAGLVVGGTAGIVTLSMAHDVNCVEGRCTGEMADRVRSARRLATVSNIGLAVGIVGTTIGVISLLTSPSGSSNSSRQGRRTARVALAAAVGPGSLFLTGSLP
jgi:hypothetical protein